MISSARWRDIQLSFRMGEDLILLVEELPVDGIVVEVVYDDYRAVGEDWHSCNMSCKSMKHV